MVLRCSCSLCETPAVRLSEFWRLVEDEFGGQYAATLASMHVIHALGDRTADQALEEGVRPGRVWVALCDDMDVPAERRLGRDVPPRRDADTP